MIILDTLEEVLNSCLPQAIKDAIKATALNYGCGDPTESLTDLVGGPFTIIQEVSELREINCAEGHSIADNPGTFDDVQEDGGWYSFLLCSCNAGGATYLVPPELVNENAIQSKLITDKLWSSIGE